MRYCQLGEDSYVEPKLDVVLSPSINKEIELIDEFNQPLGDSLYEWYDYIDGIIDYLSYAKIAFDYANRFRRLPNGSV